MSRILVVDDNGTERRLLAHALRRRATVVEASDGKGALAALSEAPVDLVLLDLHLPPDPSAPDEGVRLQRRIAESDPELPVIVITGDRDHELALEMVRRGVADFLTKPVDPRVLGIVVERALERAHLEREVARLRRQVAERFTFGGLIGESRAMRQVFARLERLARVETTVLLLGESGTGKSAVARALHGESARSGGPFVVVDGASIPEPLIESELFGHRRGAFTGAGAGAPGRLLSADGGTLFLDEVGNLGISAQAKLLLFLDTRQFTPVGAADPVSVDVRLIAASNRNLDELTAEGRFREDLLFRLRVATVTLPPLRERREDIPALAEHLLGRLAVRLERPKPRLAPAAQGALQRCDWPGNVRQLAATLESAMVLSEAPVIGAGDLNLPGAERAPDLPAGGSLKERLRAYERALIVEALAHTGGNKAAAGRRLGLDENQIRYLCRKHGL